MLSDAKKIQKRWEHEELLILATEIHLRRWEALQVNGDNGLFCNHFLQIETLNPIGKHLKTVSKQLKIASGSP